MSKILLVDDDIINIKLLEEVLEEADFSTVSAHNGKEALSQLSEHNDICLILLDWMMPEMDGMEFLKAFDAMENKPNIPIILQTAKGTNEDIIKGSSHEVYYYLTKPFDDVTLLSIVRSALKK